MTKGWKRIDDIEDSHICIVLLRALKAHNIDWQREFHAKGGKVFDRISVEAKNLCCAQTIYSSILANGGQA